MNDAQTPRPDRIEWTVIRGDDGSYSGIWDSGRHAAKLYLAEGDEYHGRPRPPEGSYVAFRRVTYGQWERSDEA